jgi:CheY-like chemotaxis protein
MDNKILVVEDDGDIRETLTQCLSLYGFSVDIASNGKEALDLLESNRCDPSLILLDIMMPVMDGWEFRSLQQHHPKLSNIPVVIITADGNAKQKAEKMGVKDGIRKPFDLEDLIEVIQKYKK